MDISLGDKEEKIKKKALKDHFFYSKYILGYSKMEEQPHRGLCNFLKDSEQDRKLILMPRGSYKSSVVTVGWVMWMLEHNPDLRILVSGETQKNSRNFVKEIKTHYEQNEGLRRIFGNRVNQNNVWRDDEFIINTRKIIKKESTVKASSLEKQSTTGQHYDIILLDDPCSPLNVNTFEQVQKTITYYRMLLSVLDPGGTIVIIGTRYSAIDLYGYLMDLANGEYKYFDFYCKSAINNETGELLFPKVLTHAFLDRQRESQGAFIFNSQYMNDPISSETSTFKKEWIKYYEHEPFGLVKFMSVDFAATRTSTADYSAFVIVGVDHEKNMYVIEALQLKLNTTENLDKVFELYRKHKFQALGLEKYMLEKIYSSLIYERQTKEDCFFPLHEVKQDNRLSKEVRIKGLQPWFQRGRVFLKQDQTDLINQIIYYPLGVKNDDLLDALKNFPDFIYPSDYVPVKDDKRHLDKVSQAAADDLKKYHPRRKVIQTRGI